LPPASRSLKYRRAGTAFSDLQACLKMCLQSCPKLQRPLQKPMTLFALPASRAWKRWSRTPKISTRPSPERPRPGSGFPKKTTSRSSNIFGGAGGRPRFACYGVGMTQEITTPVLIVGAGPVGLTMAIDLAYNGIDCMLIEKTDGHIDHPKIGTIVTRTMEFFRRWGFVEQVRTSGFPDDYKLSIVFCTALTGHQLERDDYPSTAESPIPE